tara:strand:- start:103 stop:966 length:864 start_codon:yes stop_codon:yes gene_type:complete
MRALVTGHNGYIGGNFVKKWEELGHEWVGYDYNGGSQTSHDLLSGIDENHVGDVDIIFHFAAIPRVAYSVENPKHVMSNNIVSTSVVLEYAKDRNIPVVYSSSSSVVGNGSGPASPYALSKYVGEMETLLYYRLYGLKTVALRYFNVYSYDQKAGSQYATVVCNWKKFIKENKTPYITGAGDQRRDMTHVDDIVSANVFCAENIDNNDLWGDWYDVGSGGNISLNELRKIVLKYFPDLGFQYTKERKGDVLCTEADTSKLSAKGWKSKVDLRAGLENIFRRLKEEMK